MYSSFFFETIWLSIYLSAYLSVGGAYRWSCPNGANTGGKRVVCFCLFVCLFVRFIISHVPGSIIGPEMGWISSGMGSESGDGVECEVEWDFRFVFVCVVKWENWRGYASEYPSGIGGEIDCCNTKNRLLWILSAGAGLFSGSGS